MMKLVVVASVVAFVALSIISKGLVSAVAALAAFSVVITWVLKSKQAVKRNEARIEPHV